MVIWAGNFIVVKSAVAVLPPVGFTFLRFVLASATPSVESRVNASQGRYGRAVLSSRFAEAALPDLKSIDMRRAPPARGGFLSPLLLEQMRRTLERQEQSLLFLNRRGYAPLPQRCSSTCGTAMPRR